MKKLLLVLLVVALAAVLLVGCTPVTPSEGEPIAGIDCPTSVVVTGELAVGGKKFIQGGVEKTITVTFAVPTAPVSVYIGVDISKAIPEDADEVVMYTTDNKVYTGTYTFDNDGDDSCDADYIYVETCGTCSACKYPYTTDSTPPEVELVICSGSDVCPGCAISISTYGGTVCEPDEHCYDCVGLASWTIDLYDEEPDFIACGCLPCIDPVDSGSGTACPIAFTSSYKKFDGEAWAVVNLVDQLGNSTTFGYVITLNDSCEIQTITDMKYDQDTECLDWAPDTHDCVQCILQ